MIALPRTAFMYDGATARMKENSDPEVSVIIVNYNGLRFVGNCLTSLYRSIQELERVLRLRAETVLVDNNSVDRSLEYVSRNFH